MSKDKIRLTLMVVVLAMFVATAGLWLFKSSQNGKSIESLVLLSPLILIIAIAGLVVITMLKSVRRGLPVEDEMSKIAQLKAGAYTFYIGIYWLLALGWFGDDYFERPSQATGAGIVGMALIFMVLWVYFNKKGVK